MIVKISNKAKKDIYKLDKIVIRRIYKALGKLRKEITRFKRLKGKNKINSLRVGNYRIIFEDIDGAINVLTVEHRREVYRNI